jgi:hypothetical protein
MLALGNELYSSRKTTHLLGFPFPSALNLVLQVAQTRGDFAGPGDLAGLEPRILWGRLYP